MSSAGGVVFSVWGWLTLPLLAGAIFLSFSAGWYTSEASDTPEILNLALDKASYRPGDELKVSVMPRMAGEALVAVVSDRVLATQMVKVSASGGSGYTPDTSDCGYLGSHEINNAQFVAKAGPGTPIDCGATFQAPATCGWRRAPWSVFHPQITTSRQRGKAKSPRGRPFVFALQVTERSPTIRPPATPRREGAAGTETKAMDAHEASTSPSSLASILPW